jgi:hypothetical protein
VTGLILRPVRTTDEDVVRAAHAAMTAEDFGFALGLRDDDNAGSAAVIERCGGLRDAELPLTPGPSPKRRYWFT